MVLRPERVHDAIRLLFNTSTLPDCQERDLLIGDIAAQADLFAHVMAAPYLRLRLDVIETNACRRFHIDAVVARLICTYRGTGTQYGTSRDGNDPVDIYTVPTGSPIVLRGTTWPETPAMGLRHRSPPIEGTGETRLVLVLDPVFELSDASDQHFLH